MKRTFVEVPGICPPPLREEGGPKLRHTPSPHLQQGPGLLLAEASCSSLPVWLGLAWPNEWCARASGDCFSLFELI